MEGARKQRPLGEAEAQAELRRAPGPKKHSSRRRRCASPSMARRRPTCTRSSPRRPERTRITARRFRHYPHSSSNGGNDEPARRKAAAPLFYGARTNHLKGRLEIRLPGRCTLPLSGIRSHPFHSAGGARSPSQVELACKVCQLFKKHNAMGDRMQLQIVLL